MTIYNATEAAYRNGYEKGFSDGRDRSLELDTATYNIYFLNHLNQEDETQICVCDQDNPVADIINVILSLKDEMDIKEVTGIEYVGECDD